MEHGGPATPISDGERVLRREINSYEAPRRKGSRFNCGVEVAPRICPTPKLVGVRKLQAGLPGGRGLLPGFTRRDSLFRLLLRLIEGRAHGGERNLIAPRGNVDCHVGRGRDGWRNGARECSRPAVRADDPTWLRRLKAVAAPATEVERRNSRGRIWGNPSTDRGGQVRK